MISAARYGYVFHTDVIPVMSGDPFEWRVRMAALAVYERDHTRPET